MLQLNEDPTAITQPTRQDTLSECARQTPSVAPYCLCRVKRWDAAQGRQSTPIFCKILGPGLAQISSSILKKHYFLHCYTKGNIGSSLWKSLVTCSFQCSRLSVDQMKEFYSLFSDADLVKVLNQHKVSQTSLCILSVTLPLSLLCWFLKSRSWRECDNIVFVGSGMILFPLGSLSRPQLVVLLFWNIHIALKSSVDFRSSWI